MLMLASMAAGQEAAPAFHPDRTAWGDPDLRGVRPVQNINDARIPLERPAAMGDRAWLTEEEFAERLKQAELSDASYSDDIDSEGTRGLADWLRSSRTGHAASLLVDPPDGRLPPLTRAAQVLHEAGRSSYKEGQTRFEWITDMDAFDRCITRGFPAMMLPKPYNNGVRIFQSPGWVVIDFEMIHEQRFIPLDGRPQLADGLKTWLGSSRGHWDGNTLVVETTNFNGLSPMAIVGPSNGAAGIPTSTSMKIVEHFTPYGEGKLYYEAWVEDPVVLTAPFKIGYPWVRNNDYKMFEYACHEGNTLLWANIRSTSPRFAQFREQNFEKNPEGSSE